MAGGRVYNSASSGGSSLSVLFQNQKASCASEPLDSLFVSGSSPSFLGILSLPALCFFFFFNELLLIWCYGDFLVLNSIYLPLILL
jgi:hypothetical protein